MSGNLGTGWTMDQEPTVSQTPSVAEGLSIEAKRVYSMVAWESQKIVLNNRGDVKSTKTWIDRPYSWSGSYGPSKDFSKSGPKSIRRVLIGGSLINWTSLSKIPKHHRWPRNDTDRSSFCLINLSYLIPGHTWSGTTSTTTKVHKNDGNRSTRAGYFHSASNQSRVSWTFFGSVHKE